MAREGKSLARPPPARRGARGWPWALGLLALGAAVPLGLRWAPGGSEQGSTLSGARPASQAPSTSGAPEGPSQGSRPPESMRELVSALRARYGGKLGHAHAQVRMLEELIRYFRARSPRGWEEAVLAVLREAFPEQYEGLAQRLRQWVAYAQWMQESQARLAGLEAGARREAVWEARERLFGKEAAEEIWAAERRNQALAGALAAVDARPGASVPERLAQYRESLKALHGEQAEAWLERHRQEALNHFLDLSTVQEALGSMSPPERAQSLREIRQGLGLDAAALERWEALDRARDGRWERGAAYMAEREALARQHSGAELEARLEALRRRYFGEEAGTLAQEEQSGFFRFTRPRQWGRN